MTPTLNSPKLKKVQNLPECWEDERRMKVLFSPLRDRSVNPVNYESTLNFWRNLINQYCESKGDAEISIVELRDTFQRNGHKPHCLETVISEMLNDGQLKTKDRFFDGPQNSWSGWAFGLVKKPLLWGFDIIKQKMVTQSDIVPYIVLPVVKKQADFLLNTMQNKILTMKELKAQIPDLKLSEEGIPAILHELLCVQKVVVLKINNENLDDKILLKFGTTTHKAFPLSEVEISIHNLETTEQELMELIGQVEIKIHKQEEMAKQLLSEKKKVLAKNALRKRNLMSKNLEKRTQCLENVQNILSKIHDISSDAKILDAYRMGTKSLQAAMSNSGITIETVEKAIHEMQDVMEMHDDVQSALAGPNKSTDDDIDLERELDELIKEETTEPIKENKTPKKENVEEDSLIKDLEKLSVVDDPLPEFNKNSSKSPNKPVKCLVPE